MENIPNPEQLERQTLIETLRTRGFEDAESKQLMIAWCERREAEVSAEGTREAQVNFEIERAEIYQEAGSIEDALVALEDAFTIATQEGLDELAHTIEEKIASLQ